METSCRPGDPHGQNVDRQRGRGTGGGGTGGGGTGGRGIRRRGGRGDGTRGAKLDGGQALRSRRPVREVQEAGAWDIHGLRVCRVPLADGGDSARRIEGNAAHTRVPRAGWGGIFGPPGLVRDKGDGGNGGEGCRRYGSSGCRIGRGRPGIVGCSGDFPEGAPGRSCPDEAGGHRKRWAPPGGDAEGS